MTATVADAALRQAERAYRLIAAAHDERDPQATAREVARALQDVEALRAFGTTDVRRVRQLGLDGGGRVVARHYFEREGEG
jgi:hypothetical protein